MAKKPFKGVIKLDVRDSIPDWTPYTPTKASRRSTERPVRSVRRHRSGRVVAVWRRHQHADAAEARRQRADVLAVAHHGAVLADPLHVPDRAQPPSQWCACITEGAHRLSRLRTAASRPSAPRSARFCRTAAGAHSGSARTTTSRDGLCPGASRKRVAAPEGLRPLLWLPRRRNQQLVSRPGRRQPLRRPAVHAGRGLSPLQGPCRPRAADDPRPEGQQSVEAVVHVVLPGRQPCPASCPEGIHRQVQGQVRRRL